MAEEQRPRIAELFLEKAGRTERNQMLAVALEMAERLHDEEKRSKELEAENQRLKETVAAWQLEAKTETRS